MLIRNFLRLDIKVIWIGQLSGRHRRDVLLHHKQFVVLIKIMYNLLNTVTVQLTKSKYHQNLVVNYFLIIQRTYTIQDWFEFDNFFRNFQSLCPCLQNLEGFYENLPSAGKLIRFSDYSDRSQINFELSLGFCQNIQPKTGSRFLSRQTSCWNKPICFGNEFIFKI